MKTLFKRTLCAAAVSLSIISCSKDDRSSNTLSSPSELERMEMEANRKFTSLEKSDLEAKIAQFEFNLNEIAKGKKLDALPLDEAVFFIEALLNKQNSTYWNSGEIKRIVYERTISTSDKGIVQYVLFSKVNNVFKEFNSLVNDWIKQSKRESFVMADIGYTSINKDQVTLRLAILKSEQRLRYIDEGIKAKTDTTACWDCYSQHWAAGYLGVCGFVDPTPPNDKDAAVFIQDSLNSHASWRDNCPNGAYIVGTTYRTFTNYSDAGSVVESYYDNNYPGWKSNIVLANTWQSSSNLCASPSWLNDHISKAEVLRDFGLQWYLYGASYPNYEFYGVNYHSTTSANNYYNPTGGNFMHEAQFLYGEVMCNP